MKHKLFLILFFSIFSISSFAQTDLILVDFGNTPSPLPWNNLSNPNDGHIDELVNSFGISTDISLTVIDSFNNINNSGTTMPNPNLGIASTASEDSFFGNSVLFSNEFQPTGGIQISNLDINKLYTFSIFSSRIATDNRETQYEIAGMTNDIGYLNVSSNTDSIVVLSSYPTVDGIIQISATTGPNNNNTFGFFYLGALKIEYPADSIVAPSLTLLQPNGDEFWQADKTVNVKWESSIPSSTTIEYSIDNGASWIFVETIPPFQHSYSWTIPNNPSKECLVRITSDAFQDESDSIFEISSDASSCPIVVIGSSTAAGSGASNPDSAWVNKFREEIYQNDTRYSVINLARGGYTTYHLLPTGNPLAGNVGITIDTARNISKALSFNPSNVIINLPSNDAANLFPVADQLVNFQLMVDAASMQGVETWVCTTQPRNFSNAVQIQIQMDARDSIFSIYGNNALDFWNGIAQTNGWILSQFDSGDGVHLNDAGHRLLFERAFEKNVLTINDNPIAPNFYSAINKIISQGTVNGGDTVVTFRAGNSISLVEGFIASSGPTSDFTAYIDPCGNSASSLQNIPNPKLTYIPSNESTPTIEVIDQLSKNTKLELEIFPNPFEATTNLFFYIEKNKKVNLAIYDATGRLHQQLIDEQLPDGEHQISLDATNYPKGIYLAMLRIGNKNISKRMIVF